MAIYKYWVLSGDICYICRYEQKLNIQRQNRGAKGSWLSGDDPNHGEQGITEYSNIWTETKTIDVNIGNKREEGRKVVGC